MSTKFLGPFVSYDGLDPSDTSSFDNYRVYANFSNFMEIYQEGENAEIITMYRHLYKGTPPTGSFTGAYFEFYVIGEEDSLADSDYGFTKFLNRNVSNVLTSSPEQVIIKPEYPQSLAAVSQQTYCSPF